MFKKSPQKDDAAAKRKSIRKNEPFPSGPPETAAPDSALRQRIARKAYELYERRGWVHGLDIQDWLEAERLILAETAAKTDAQADPQLRKRSRPAKAEEASGLV